ncbi:hypothetical protein [Solitalea lacus]|uniref:hypothetical protein n=1 Tax=Solitalea lacus TaxID=2911172 RepID=UPI001EDBDEFD|nr:hypothetical protein [Solitalea lacus]UKJ06182.1 hypothetical protein L2B55_11600 [Solitalea lacus]
MKIPLPPNGHWMKLKHGKVSPKAEIPNDYEGEDTINLQTTDIDPLVKDILETQGFTLKVPNKLINLDQLILEAQHSFSEKPSNYLSGPNRGTSPHCIDIRATPKNANRALRIMNTLIGNFKARGFTI